MERADNVSKVGSTPLVKTNAEELKFAAMFVIFPVTKPVLLVTNHVYTAVSIRSVGKPAANLAYPARRSA